MPNEDTRHMTKIRSAGDRTISNPGDSKTIQGAPARDLITPARFAGKTMTGRGATSPR